MLNHYSGICEISKFHPEQKKKIRVGFKNAFLGKFRREIEKATVIFEISTFEYIIYKVSCKTKKPCVWNQKCLIWVLLV